ncbi:hypothetical protein CAP35_15235 [Chitinophagaceae bacterium IBVUCB1]|nr:hypothetical protein CAP35_15235 [Chitinophagaceae bacterium IBVUCB1]
MALNYEISIANKLQSFFEPYIKADATVWSALAERMSVKRFNKNELIKAANKKESHLYLVTQGSAGLFVSKDGHDICIDLCYVGHFTGDYYSLLQQQIPQQQDITNEVAALLLQNSPIYVMALEATETLAITKADLFSLYNESDIGRIIAGKIAELLYMQKQSQQIEILTMTAEQRYIQMLAQYPDMLQKTAGKHIASYLGISPESLSRIKKKLAS